MADFTIGGVAYQSRLMDGETHALVLKRILPTLTALAGLIEQIPEVAATLRVAMASPLAPGSLEVDEGGETPNARLSRAVMPVAREIAALPDADLRFVLDTCLDLTSRRLGMGEGWVPVRQRGVIQDRSDGSLKARLGIAWHVLGENFGSVLISMGVDVEGLRRAAAVASHG